MNKNSTQLAALLLALTITPCALAGVYKYVDDNGNTVYTDQQPQGEANNIEKLNVKDAYTNTMPATNPRADNTSRDPVFNRMQQKQKQEESYASAKRKAKIAAKRAVEAAKNNLEEAKVLQAGDMLKNIGGGIRYTPQYLQRIEAAQMNLDAAQQAYSQF